MRGDDIAGMAVHLAARVTALAGSDEIWVSETVPGLVVGSGLTFEELGAHDLKGLPGRWDLYRVVGPQGRASAR